MQDKLVAAHRAGKLNSYGARIHLVKSSTFAACLAPLRTTRWFVYAKRPFAGPQAVLAYLSRYTHRVAIANSRLVGTDGKNVTFKYKDYRIKGRQRHKTMTLGTRLRNRRQSQAAANRDRVRQTDCSAVPGRSPGRLIPWRGPVPGPT